MSEHVLIPVCKFCGKIRKHGQWVELTDDDRKQMDMERVHWHTKVCKDCHDDHK